MRMKKSVLMCIGLICCMFLNALCVQPETCYAADAAGYCGDSAFVAQIKQECAGKSQTALGKKYYISPKGS